MNKSLDRIALSAATCLVVLLAAGQAAAQLGPNGLPLNPDAAPRADTAAPRADTAAPRADTAGPLDQLMAWERQDMHVPPSPELHGGAMHGPTPNQIPGGQVITTKGLVWLLQQSMPVVVIDALGGTQTLPNALRAAWTSQPGSFDDQTQQQMAQMLQQVTRGNNEIPLVFYCGGPQCWLSYNAALRAIKLGYRNVLWYRGGFEAWQRAGQPLVPVRQAIAPQ